MELKGTGKPTQRDSCRRTLEINHLYSWYGSKKLCFLQTPSKNEQNQTTKKLKNMPRTVKTCFTSWGHDQTWDIQIRETQRSDPVDSLAQVRRRGLEETEGLTRSSSRASRIGVPTFFCSLHFSRGTEPPNQKRGEKGTDRWGT